MGKYVTFGKVRDLEKQKIGRPTSDASAMGKIPTVGESTPVKIPTVEESPTVVPTTPVKIPTVEKSHAWPRETPTVEESPTVGEIPMAPSSRAKISVEAKDGELRIPNAIAFNLYPLLDLSERAVYAELFMWTHGFRRTEHRISRNKLCERLGVTPKTLRAIVAKLEKKGLVEAIDAEHGGPQDKRGTLFRVHLPTIEGEPAKAKGKGKPPTVGKFPTVGASPTMKDHESNHGNTPAAVAPAIDIFGIRTIAARLFEAHRNEQTFSHARLAELVRDVLIGQGTAANEAMIEEAIRGMAT